MGRIFDSAKGVVDHSVSEIKSIIRQYDEGLITGAELIIKISSKLSDAELQNSALFVCSYEADMYDSDDL